MNLGVREMKAASTARSFRKQRVVLAIESSGPGGAEHIVLRLADELRRAGAEPIVATLRSGWMTHRAESVGLPVWVVPQRRGLDLGWVLRFAARLRREQIDIFHAHESTMSLFGGAAALIAGVRALSTLHGRHRISKKRSKLFSYRVLRSLGVQIVAVSHDLARFLAGELRLEPAALHVIHNGVPLPTRPPREERHVRASAARNHLSIPDDGALVVAVGNLYPVKDHATLLRAVARVPGTRLAIAGRGEQESRLRQLAHELDVTDRLYLLGLRDDVERVLEAADLFVQPSRSEGLPLAILEAMAAGLPVVATAVGGIGEAVEDEKTGHLVPPGDPDALADAVTRVLFSKDRGETLGEAGRVRVEEEFSVSAMAARYRDLYQGRTGSPRRRPQHHDQEENDHSRPHSES